jgi:transketolase
MVDACTKKLKNLRKKILEISFFGQDGNLQSVFSALEIMWVLYDKVINLSPENYDERDLFVLSKGQATLGLFIILAENGIFSYDELNTFCKFDSRFSMQADKTKFEKGIENSAGSLGHGFPMAVGMAMANKIKGIKSKVITLVGDGEFNEGTMWEAAILAGHKKLDNLCLIIDDNSSIGKMVNMGDMAKKLNEFGFKTTTINGHDCFQIYDACTMKHDGAPHAIIAKTFRGYGCETMMNKSEWFHKAPNKKELEILLREVDSFEKANV